MMTEEQAREKWCPHARVSASNEPALGNHAANRWENPQGLPDGAGCIASDCMAWRWQDSLSIRDGEQPSKSNNGYCGLAGKQ